MLLILLLVAVGGVLVDPICEECLTGVAYTTTGKNWERRFDIQLEALSYSQLWLDFRHVSLDGSSYNVTVMVGEDSMNLTDLSGKASQYSLLVEQGIVFGKAALSLSVLVELNDSSIVNRHLFLNSVSLNSIRSDLKQPTVRRQYIWVANQQDSINQPFNFPTVDQLNSSVFLTKITDSLSSGLHGKGPALVSSNYANDWNVPPAFIQNMEGISVPYIPYFSNCEGGNIYPTKWLQNSSWCNLVPIDKIQPVNQLMFGMTPYSDSCNVQLQCVYDEDPTLHGEMPYWQTLPAGVNVMHITKDKVDSDSYQSDVNSSNLIGCQVNSSEGTNSSDRFPTTVELSLNYYQVSATESHLISCTVNYGLYTDAVGNLSYTLTLKKKPLNHTYILIAFGFDNYVYIIAFILIGLISNMENLLLALYHYVVNRRPRQPLKVRVYLHILKGMFQGSLAAIIPLLIVLALVNVTMLGELFGTVLYHFPNSIANNGQGPHVFWDLITKAFYLDYSADEPTRIRAGRQGFSLMIVASIIIGSTAHYFIGWQRPKSQTQQYFICGAIVRPQDYFQTKFLLGTMAYIMIQLGLMYFAYTTLFSNNIWVFIVFTKILQMVLEELTDVFFNDVMQCTPMKLITEITSYLNTLAANNFYDFMFSFLIDVGLTMIEKAYVASLQNIFSEWIKAKYQLVEAYINKLFNQEEEQKEMVKDMETIEHDDQDKQVYIVCGAGEPVTFDNQQEQYNELGEDSDVEVDSNEVVFKKKLAAYSLARLKGSNQQQVTHQHSREDELQELEERNNTTLEFTADLFGMPLSLVLQPFAILTLWLTYNQSLILQNYVIAYKYTPIYLLSAVMIGLFTIVNMVCLFFLLENYHALDIEEYIRSILRRFEERTKYWKADEYDIRNQFEEKLRSIDSFCLSSQFYFLITLYIAAMFLLVVGLATIAGQSYNPLSDPCSILIAAFWAALTKGKMVFWQWMGRVVGIWDYKRFHSENKVHCGSDEKYAEKAQELPEESSHVFLKPQTAVADSSKGLLSCQGTVKNEVVESPSEDSTPTDDFPCCSIASEKQATPTGLQITRMSRRVEQMKELRIKLQSICRKLQPKFSQQAFQLEYSLKNKDYIKDNFEKIISSVDQLPEIPEDILNYDSSATVEVEQQVQRLHTSKDLLRALSYWLHETRRDREHRKNNGLETEKAIKCCRYCFGDWGVYFGFGGMCLPCYQRLKKRQ